MPLFLPLLMFPLDARPEPEPPAKYWVYVGTYTGAGGSKGIYRFDLDPRTGQLTSAGLVAEVASPSFLALHPSGKYLYAVSEVSNFAGKKAGAVSAFAVEPGTGRLTLLNQQPSGGTGPCHVSVDHGGKNVLVANYNSGSAEALPIDADGKLLPPSVVVQHKGTGPDKRRQEGPHAHSANLDISDRFAIVADLGLDQLRVYRFDRSSGKLTPNEPPFYTTAPGAGPRHFAFHPDGRQAYVINELNLTLSALAWDPQEGRLTEKQTVSTLPEGAERKGASTAEVVVHPSGKFVYGSNRGHNSIVGFAIDGQTGKLTLIGHQGEGIKTPRNFNIDPSGRWLIVANQDGASLVVFRIDPETGKLTPTGQRVPVPAPVCVKFLAPR